MTPAAAGGTQSEVQGKAPFPSASMAGEQSTRHFRFSCQFHRQPGNVPTNCRLVFCLLLFFFYLQVHKRLLVSTPQHHAHKCRQQGPLTGCVLRLSKICVWHKKKKKSRVRYRYSSPTPPPVCLPATQLTRAIFINTQPPRLALQAHQVWRTLWSSAAR